MISTENLKFLTDIPDTWIFEYYLNLSEHLNGQSINILSVFNSKDSNPSMFIYLDINDMKYKFKDFSSGYSGDGINLIEYLYNLNYKEAVAKIQQDFSASKSTNSYKRVLQIFDKYKVIDYQIRHWNKEDAKYWLSYKLNSDILEHYNVFPLEYYVMSKRNPDNTIQSFTKRVNYCYGYFTKEGELYKIYQPKQKNQKFIKVKKYTQGWDQLTFNSKYLVLTSGLKDLMCFNKLGIGNIESMCPDSENTILPNDMVNFLKLKYKRLFILFDNDEGGRKSSKKYKELYNIDSVTFNISSDIAEGVREKGLSETKKHVFENLKLLI